MNIDRRTSLKLLACTGSLLAASTVVPMGCSRSSRTSPPTPTEAMKRAADFMRANCAQRGGYVWEYAADFTRRWGEMEAYPTMIWIQSPGTATMGHLFLDCYHATNDEYYYEAAAEVAAALQHELQRPNVLVFMTEDVSPRVGAFGDAVASTPNLDALAELPGKIVGPDPAHDHLYQVVLAIEFRDEEVQRIEVRSTYMMAKGMPAKRHEEIQYQGCVASFVGGAPSNGY